jgi:hypothetical protein
MRPSTSASSSATAACAWQAITRFYANCQSKRPGKKGYTASATTVAQSSTRVPAGSWILMGGI